MFHARATNYLHEYTLDSEYTCVPNGLPFSRSTNMHLRKKALTSLRTSHVFNYIPSGKTVECMVKGDRYPVQNFFSDMAAGTNTLT